MTQIRILTALCAGIFLWTTCTTESDKSDLLSDAIHAVDDNPQQALELLKSISPEYLYDYDKGLYMQFVVILTQARYMDYQDITVDSLILDAQRYFARGRDYEMAARASYYAASYWNEGEASDKTIEYWQAAFLFAEKADNNIFMAKSAYSLGMSYYNQEQWEDALPYCRKALEFYDDKPDNERYKLSLINMLGQIYREQKDFEHAYLFFDDGLKAAKKLNNTKYESRFLRNKGIIHRDKGEYKQAKEYFDLALSNQPEPEDKLRIYLSYSRLYRDINRPDSTIYYLNMIKEHLSEITYSNTLRDIYAELVTYYQSYGGSIGETAHALLADIEDLRIKNNQSEKKVHTINQQFEQLKEKKQMEGRTYRRIFDYGLIALLLLASLLIIAWFNKRGLKEKYAQIKEKYIQSQKEYTQIKEEHSEIKERYIQTSAEYQQAKEEYIRVEKKYLQTEKKYAQIKEKYTQANEEYIQIKEEYALAKKKYNSTDVEYIQIKWEYARVKEKYEQIENKYYRISNQHFNLTLNQLYFSDAGLKSIAKSIDYLYQNNLAHAGSPLWEQQLMFRERFCDQLAEFAKITLKKRPNGPKALLNLKPEQLPIIQLARLKHSNEEISRMLGYEGKKKNTVKLYKKQIRLIMTEAGMTDKDIMDLLPEKASH